MRLPVLTIVQLWALCSFAQFDSFVLDDVTIMAVRNNAGMITNTAVSGSFPTSIRQYIVQYPSISPSVHYLSNIGLSDTIEILSKIGADYLVVTKDDGGLNPFEYVRQNHPLYSADNKLSSMMFFDGMMRRCRAVNYVVAPDYILEMTGDKTVDKIPEFAIYKIDGTTVITNMTSWLSSNCVVSNYPSSFINKDVVTAWSDLLTIFSDAQTNSSVRRSYASADNNVNMRSSTIATLYVDVIDVLVKKIPQDSEIQCIRDLEISGGDVFIDHDDKLVMKSLSEGYNPSVRFVAYTNGTFCANSAGTAFRADMTILGENVGTNVTSLTLNMNTGDSLTISASDIRFDTFTFDPFVE